MWGIFRIFAAAISFHTLAAPGIFTSPRAIFSQKTQKSYIFFAIIKKSVTFVSVSNERLHGPGRFPVKNKEMKQDITKKGLDANFNEIAVVVKYDSMGVNQGTFYKDIEGEHEMSENMANLLFEDNVCLR